MALDDTLLTISPVDLPPWSARGLTQTLAFISGARQLYRTTSGKLVDMSLPGFRKYRSVISCQDQRTILSDRIHEGIQCTVNCVAELFCEEYESPARDYVEGSLREENGLVFYRPILVMRVAGIQTTFDEWGATVGWSLSLEEV